MTTDFAQLGLYRNKLRNRTLTGENQPDIPYSTSVSFFSDNMSSIWTWQENINDFILYTEAHLLHLMFVDNLFCLLDYSRQLWRDYSMSICAWHTTSLCPYMRDVSTLVTTHKFEKFCILLNDASDIDQISWNCMIYVRFGRQ